MSDIEIDVEVTGQRKVTRAIRRSVNRGLRSSGNVLAREARHVAQDRIAEKERIFTSELIKSFETTNVKDGDGRFISVSNNSEYAATVDEGRKPGARAPPVAALIPWVLAHLSALQKPSDNDGSGTPGSSSPSSSDGAGVSAGGSSIESGWKRIGEEFEANDVYEGMRVKVRNTQRNTDLGKGVVINVGTDGIRIRLDRDRSVISVDYDIPNFERITSGQRWGDVPRADRRSLIVDNWGNNDETPSSVPGSSYSFGELNQSQQEELNNAMGTLVDRARGDNDLLYMRGVNRTEAQGKILTPKRTQGVVFPKQMVEPSRRDNVFGIRGNAFGDQTAQEVAYHESAHLIGSASGFARPPGGGHSENFSPPFVRFNIDESTGNSIDTSFHPNPIALMNHNEDDYNTVQWTGIQDGAPRGYEKIIDEVPGQIDDQDTSTTIVSNPDAPDYLDPKDGDRETGDKWVIDRPGSMFEDVAVLQDTEPIPALEGGEYKVKINENEEFLAFDENNELIDGEMVEWQREERDIDVSQENAQSFLQTDMDDEPLQAYYEAVNRAWYAQVVANSREFNGGADERNEYAIDSRGYSNTNADETAATMHQIMNSEITDEQETLEGISRIDIIASRHPYLMRAWLNLFNPSTEAGNELSNLGINF